MGATLPRIWCSAQGTTLPGPFPAGCHPPAENPLPSPVCKFLTFFPTLSIALYTPKMDHRGCRGGDVSESAFSVEGDGTFWKGVGVRGNAQLSSNDTKPAAAEKPGHQAPSSV